MCQITTLRIFLFVDSAQDSDLAQFLKMEKLSEIEPPLIGFLMHLQCHKKFLFFDRKVCRTEL